MTGDGVTTIVVNVCPACSCMFTRAFPCPRCGADSDSTITSRVIEGDAG